MRGINGFRQDAADIKKRIYKLEYLAEQAAPEAKAEREKKELRDLVKTLDGVVFIEPWRAMAEGARVRWKAKFRGHEMVIGVEWIRGDGSTFEPELVFGERFSYARSHSGSEVLNVDSY